MSGPAPREERTAAGLLVMALGAAMFTCIDTSAKWLSAAGLPVLQIAFVRYGGHLVFALALGLAQDGPGVFRSAVPRVQFLRALALMGSTVLNFIALSYLPLTVTTTIMFAGPVVVTLLAIPMLGEKVGPHRIGAVIAGFFGVVVVMQPWGAAFHPAMLLPVLALVSSSFYFILTRRIAGVERNTTGQIWTAGVATLALAPFGLAVWQGPSSGQVWAVMTVIGVFGALGHIFATSAHRLADASILAPVIYIQIVLAAVASFVVFGTWPTVWTLAGGVIIAASGLYIWHRERLKAVSPDR
jgi:drug/metabolite transporter (DMT)-like permease